jgi:hypothetical protein
MQYYLGLSEYREDVLFDTSMMVHFKKYEFGQKVSSSVINGYTFIERQSYDNFNEGITLKLSYLPETA